MFIAAVYDVISGPAGEARNWDRFRSLFLPGARIIPAGRAPEGEAGPPMLSAEDYVRGPGARIDQMDFFETEIGRVEERFGPVAHLFSTYQSARSPDAEPFSRGINSFQLMYDGSRWWVVTIFFASEQPDRPIPEKYLNRTGG